MTGFSLEEHGQGAESLLATFEQLRPADLANVLHHLSAEAPRRGRRRARRRPARRRPGGAARGRPGRDPRQAQGGARRRRPGGDGPGRRRRPALRAARGGQGAAAGADAAATTPRDVRRLLSYEERHGRRPDDHRADRAAAGRHRRATRSPGSATRTCPPRWPRRSTCAGRRTRRRPASTWARCTSSGCCGTRRSRWSARSSTPICQPLRAGHHAAVGDQLSGDVQHGGGAGRRRGRVAAGRGHRRRRAGPPAARTTGGRRSLAEAARAGGPDGRRPRMAAERDRARSVSGTASEPGARARRGERGAAPRACGWTSRARRGAGCCPSTTRRPSAGSPSGSRASWAPAGSSSG